MRRRTALAALATTLAAPAVHAQALLRVRFTLDWVFQGPQGAFLLALDRGYFRAEGLDVVMDRGAGSGETPVRIAGGAYDVGVGDISPTIRLKLERPELDLFTPLIIYDATALAVMSVKREGITKPADLVGKLLGAPETDGGRQLFPAFARAAGIDPASVRWLTVTPQLRETMLARGQVNAITGFTTSGIFSLRRAGVADSDIVTMRFSDVGADFYSTALITSRRFAEANPRAMTGMIRALVRAQYDALRDPAGTIEVLLKRETLTDVPLETERLKMALDTLTFTTHVNANGFGQVDMTRLQRNIDMVRAAFAVERPLPAADVYDPKYLPAGTDLKLA